MAHSTPPLAFFALVLPSGIGNGFVSVTLPFALTEAGFSVAEAASIVALGLSANVWLFLWGPLADLTLTLRRWYVIGVAASAFALLSVSLMPLRENALLPLVVLASQVAASWILPPVGGLMAHTVADNVKGHAAGWYQAGLLTGTGAGGGLGVWLVDNFSLSIAGAALSSAMIACLIGLHLVPAIQGTAGETLGHMMRLMQQDFREMLRSRPVLFVVVLVCTPVGIGAASRLWSAVAPDWSATPDTVALVTGVLSALVSAVGSVTGGAIAVRFGRWWAFFGAGALMALVALVMAASPRTPGVYVVGVLFYSFTLGLATAGFLSVVLHAIGRGAASTKFSIFWSLGNVPTVYMIAFNGWMHDHFGAPGMLAGEALLALSFIVLAVTALWKLSSRAPIPDRAGA